MFLIFFKLINKRKRMYYNIVFYNESNYKIQKFNYHKNLSILFLMNEFFSGWRIYYLKSYTIIILLLWTHWSIGKYVDGHFRFKTSSRTCLLLWIKTEIVQVANIVKWTWFYYRSSKSLELSSIADYVVSSK